MTEVIDLAKSREHTRTLNEKFGAPGNRPFVEADYKPDPEHPQTRVVLSAERVVVIGHSENRAACVAITAAVQAFAAIAKALGEVKNVELDEKGKEPVYDVVLRGGPTSTACINGLLATFMGISKQAPGSLVISDGRTLKD